jgi:hypothetical protein
MTARRRHLVPYAFLGVMSALALAAALLALATGPSLNQIDLQIAVGRTAAEPNFNFTTTEQVKVHIARLTTTRLEVTGTWQAPDTVRLRSSGNGGYQSITITGIDPYNFGPLYGFFEVTSPSSKAGSSTDDDEPLIELPPLGAIASAGDVSLHGDDYSFTVPKLTLPFGWVAYAPLAKKASAPTYPMSIDAHMSALVHNGRVVSITYVSGEGIQSPGDGADLHWVLFDFGAVPPIKAPTLSRR